MHASLISIGILLPQKQDFKYRKGLPLSTSLISWGGIIKESYVDGGKNDRN
jgi:hypothetical protein